MTSTLLFNGAAVSSAFIIINFFVPLPPRHCCCCRSPDSTLVVYMAAPSCHLHLSGIDFVKHQFLFLTLLYLFQAGFQPPLTMWTVASQDQEQLYNGNGYSTDVESLDGERKTLINRRWVIRKKFPTTLVHSVCFSLSIKVFPFFFTLFYFTILCCSPRQSR